MACSTGRCALRRFDGHGTSSYRPTNSEAGREFQSRMDQLLAERSQQDKGVFSVSSGSNTAGAQPVTNMQSMKSMQVSVPIHNTQIIETTQTKYYSLSDTK